MIQPVISKSGYTYIYSSYINSILLSPSENEYVDIDDFYVSKNRIYILDNATMRLLEYDITGGYIKTLDISRYWANGVFAINDMIYLINHDSDTHHGKYHIFEIDSNGVLVNRYWKCKEMAGIGPDMNVCSSIDGEFHVCILPENSIYKIDTSLADWIIKSISLTKICRQSILQRI